MIRVKHQYTRMMELVDMQDLKFCLSRGPGSSPGTGILI